MKSPIQRAIYSGPRTLVQRCATSHSTRCVSRGACCPHSTILVASATCWGFVAETRYIYGADREWPWTRKSFVWQVRKGQSGEVALIPRRSRPMKRRSARGRWKTIRRGGFRCCLSLQSERGGLRERMLKQEAETMAVTWAERAVTEWRMGPGGLCLKTTVGKGGRRDALSGKREAPGARRGRARRDGDGSAGAWAPGFALDGETGQSDVATSWCCCRPGHRHDGAVKRSLARLHEKRERSPVEA